MNNGIDEVDLTTKEQREEICYRCPLYIDGICNNNLYLNPKTGEISYKLKEGFFKGCGCLIRYKVKSKSAKCPAKKW